MKEPNLTFLTAIVLVTIGFSHSTTQADNNAKILEQLNGTWKGGVLNGAQGHVLVFKGKGVAATQNANDLGAGNLVLDSSKKPWTLDAKGTKGGHKGQDRLGILTIDGDSLKWCVSLGKNRPADFKTGGQNFCLSLKKTGDNAKILEQLNGTWKGGVLNGAQGHVLVFKGKGVAATQNANDLGAGNLVLDSSKKPWTLDAKGTKGGHKGQDRLGILTIDGDSLKWCVSLGKNRPADFKTGGQNFCLSLKKKK